MPGGGYILAPAALILWIPLSVAAFLVLRPAAAGVLCVLGGYLLLPEKIGFDLPRIPPLDKSSIAVLSCLLGALVSVPGRLISARPLLGVEGLMLLLVVCGFFTVFTNSDTLIYGPTVLPSLKLYDGVSMAIRDLLGFGLPFFLGRALVRSSRDLKQVLVLAVAAALAYSVFALVELRMSPQFHKWVYGYGAASFGQQIRGSGWRPTVFLSHGLDLARFLCLATLAAAALYKARARVIGIPGIVLSLYLFAILLASRSMAAILYVAALLPVVLLLQPRNQLRASIAMCCLVVAYPALRAADLFPDAQLTGAARRVSDERAQSLDFRFENESALVEKALQRPIFGWGGFGRQRVYTENGRDSSVTDGLWIILLGQRGVVGLFVIFGLYLFPVLMAASRLKRIRGRQERAIVAGLALILSIHLVNALPNTGLPIFPTFLAGALAGVSRSLARSPDKSKRVSTRLALRKPAPAVEPALGSISNRIAAE